MAEEYAPVMVFGRTVFAFSRGNQSMESLPESCINSILCFMEVEDVCRCACISRAWASCLHNDVTAKRVGSVQKIDCSGRNTNSMKSAEILSLKSVFPPVPLDSILLWVDC